MKKTLCYSLGMFAGALLVLAITANLLAAPKRTYKRVKPDTSKVNSDPFFKDVFGEGLAGDGPATSRS